jgi:hypothetical protein
MSASCTREQLGDAETLTGEPDSAGQIYGAFRLVNVSDQPCLVDGSGQMDVVPIDAAVTDEADVEVLDPGEGEQLATALPEPEATEEELLLEPGSAFEVQFAYVPEDGSTGGGCVQSGPTDEPSPDPTEPSSGTGDPTTGTDAGGTSDGTGDTPDGEADGGTSGSTSGGTSGGTSNGAGNGTGETSGETGGDADGDTGGGGGTNDGGVVLVYTPDAGEPPAAEIELPGICSGTVYRTDALPTETG